MDQDLSGISFSGIKEKPWLCTGKCHRGSGFHRRIKDLSGIRVDPRRDVHGKNRNTACADCFHCPPVLPCQRTGYANSKDGIYDNSIFPEIRILNLTDPIIFRNFLLCSHAFTVFFRISKTEQFRIHPFRL